MVPNRNVFSKIYQLRCIFFAVYSKIILLHLLFNDLYIMDCVFAWHTMAYSLIEERAAETETVRVLT